MLARVIQYIYNKMCDTEAKKKMNIFSFAINRLYILYNIWLLECLLIISSNVYFVVSVQSWAARRLNNFKSLDSMLALKILYFHVYFYHIYILHLICDVNHVLLLLPMNNRWLFGCL